MKNRAFITATHRILDTEVPLQIGSGLCALAVMTKVPQIGKVKTRLVPPLTSAEAAAVSTCFLRDTAEAVSLASRKGLGIVAMAVYTPVGKEESYKDIIPKEFYLIPQRGDSLGDRLIFATKDILDIGFQSVCLIGSDSPTVPPRIYEDAVRRLAQSGDRLVLGPSNDGGYYLIGLKKPHHIVFQRISWSSKNVLSQTIERAAEIGVGVETLPTWYDVDNAATLNHLCQELFEPGSGDEGAYHAPHSRTYLKKLLQSERRDCIWPNGRRH